METIREFLQNFINPFYLLKIKIPDIIEILLIAVLIYNIIKWMKNTRAGTLVKGLLVLFLLYMVASILNFDAILWLFKNGIGVSITAMLIVFQPELRKALEQLGNKNIVNPFFRDSEEDKFSEDTINGIIKATYEMAKVRTGALMIIERQVRLDDYEQTGIMLDAKVSSELLINIFEHNTPLHDGAVIIRGNRVTAATCYLPLTSSTSISKELGTRHRAAIGLSEVTDSFIIIVSEETGAVSIASEGEITRRVTRENLYDKLKEIQNKANKAAEGKGKKNFLGIERHKSPTAGKQ